LEEDLDHLQQLGEREATVRQGGDISDDYSDSASHDASIIGNRQGLVRGPTQSGKLEHWKGVKPSRFLKSIPPRSITDLDKLPFQEGRPLTSSINEEGWAASTKHFTLDREVFMIHGDKDNDLTKART
jgi:hypothetical protein